MNRERVVGGIIFIGVGILLLLANMGVISWWSFGSLFAFWPLIIIIIGINMMFRSNTIVSAGSWILFFSILIGYSLYYDYGGRNILPTENHLKDFRINRHQETIVD